MLLAAMQLKCDRQLFNKMIKRCLGNLTKPRVIPEIKKTMGSILRKLIPERRITNKKLNYVG